MMLRRNQVEPKSPSSYSWRALARRKITRPTMPADDLAIEVGTVEELYPPPEHLDAAQFAGSDAHVAAFEPNGPSVALAYGAFHAAIAHATAHPKVEVGGLCLGRVFNSLNDERLLIRVDEMIPAEHTESGPASVTFTTETWLHLFNLCEAQFPLLRVLGWYHTHPGFGVFLSGMDRFIHDNFFVANWQIAVVIDPIQRHAGVFARCAQGSLVPMLMHWNDDLHLTQMSPNLGRNWQRKTR